MKNAPVIARAIAMGCVLGAVVPIAAHHSLAAEFDVTRMVTVQAPSPACGGRTRIRGFTSMSGTRVAKWRSGRSSSRARTRSIVEAGAALTCRRRAW